MGNRVGQVRNALKKKRDRGFRRAHRFGLIFPTRFMVTVKSMNLPSDMLTSNVCGRISEWSSSREHEYLGLRHILQGKKVDSAIEDTSRVEFLRRSDGLKSFNNGHRSRGILDLFALLLLFLVPFPDTYRHHVEKSEWRRSSVPVQTTDVRYQRDHPGYHRSSRIDTHDHNGSIPYRAVVA